MKKNCLLLALLLIATSLSTFATDLIGEKGNHEYRQQLTEGLKHGFLPFSTSTQGTTLPKDMAALKNDLAQAPYRPVEVITKDQKGEPLFKYVYVYDKEGRDLGVTGPCIVRNYYTWDKANNRYVKNTRFRAVLDEAGDMTLYYQDKVEGDRWMNDYRFVATYDENHNQLTASQELWEGNAYIAKLRWTNEYDSQGRITEQMYENRYAGTEWTKGARVIWEYDERGNETKREYLSWKNGGYISLNADIRTYDERDNILTRVFQMSGGNTKKIHLSI